MMRHLAAFLTLLCVVAQESQAVEYVAEGYFVVDNTAVQRYIREDTGTTSSSIQRSKALDSMNQDIDYILTEVNQLLATLQSGELNIQVKKRKVEFLTLESDVFTRDFKGTGGLWDTNILPDFKAWLNQRNSYQTLNFDFALLWTGYDLYGELGTRATGGAYLGTVCLGSRASGVIEFTGEYGTVIQTARAIAGIMGASTAGPGVKDIMSNNLTPVDGHRWEFSDNTAREIRAVITETSCLTLNSIWSTTPTSSLTTYTGSILDPDVSCQRERNDPRSYMCKHPNGYGNTSASGDALCGHIACWMPGTPNCIATYTPEGLVCNPNKMCDEGSCVYAPSSRTRNVKAGCVHGDQKRVNAPANNFDDTCKEFVSRFGKLNCYNWNFTNLCCDTCEDVCKGPEGCECGDHARNCADYTKESLCPRYGDVCCNYCRGFRAKRSIFGTSNNTTLVIKLDDHFERVEYEMVHESAVRGRG